MFRKTGDFVYRFNSFFLFLNEDKGPKPSLLTEKTLFTMTKTDDEASDVKDSKEDNKKEKNNIY